MGRSLLILLDTNVVLWVAFDADRLSKKARETLEEARRTGEGLAISDMTLLELAMLASKKRIPLNVSVESFLSDVETRLSVLPMNAKICACAFTLPLMYFKDPADRIIAATALAAGLTLITSDRKIRKSGVVSTIW
jgi:PIN domain nuclease of toxin-antitoxin system